MYIQVSANSILEYDLPSKTGLSVDELLEWHDKAKDHNMILQVNVPIKNVAFFDD